jgi:Predicted membrane protein
MDDNAPSANPSKDFNKLDLTQLQGFSFGTQWTQDKTTPSRDSRRDDRPRRAEGGDARRDGGEVRRDRRAFRKPAGAPAEEGDAGEAPARAHGGERREGGEFRGGPRRDFRGGPRREGGERGEFRGPRQGGREGGYQGHGGAERERGPYISPFFNVTFYPEDTGFAALAKAIRSSCRTYELFEIARVIVGKNDRFVAVIQRKAAEGNAEGAAKPAPLAISVPDGLPFENEEAAITHVMSNHLGLFFDSAEVEVDPPKGSFQVINKCSITGELLGPPNYHRYNQIVQQHHAARITRMSLDAYRSRIESVRDPEVVNQWLEKMKKVTRYTWKHAPEGTTPLTFDSLDDARGYLLANAREKVVKTVENARFHGKLLEQLPQGEIRRAIEGTLERQRRFPLDTANALRGRLRREGFTIFKKGSKGVSYVCAVKRKFRVPGQTFSDSIGALISFIEANPMVKASELPVKFAGIQAPTTPAPTAPAAPAETDTAATPAAPQEAAPIATGSNTPFSAQAHAALTAEDQAKLHRLNSDLRWLVTEGYVTEFIDGRLFAPPPMTEARKQEVEKDDHDPENFPEVPPTPAAQAPEPAPAAPAEAPAEASAEPEAAAPLVAEAAPSATPEGDTPKTE